MNPHLKSIFCFLIILFLASCRSAWRQPIPDVEIMYQTGLVGQNEIGFIHADGSNSAILKVGGFLRKPVWSSDGGLIYGLTGGFAYPFGNPAYWDLKSGEFKVCRKGYFNQFFDQIEEAGNGNSLKEVLINDARTIVLVDLAKCELIKELVNFSESFKIKGISFSSRDQELLYGLVTYDQVYRETLRIIKKDLKTGEEVGLAEGISPSWSPDGSQIAYVGVDGIYVMKSDGTQPHQLVKHNFIDPQIGSGEVVPVPRWSPDGKWIVYHRCGKYDCFVNENTIYKVGVAQGQEVKIIDGGGYPSWKP